MFNGTPTWVKNVKEGGIIALTVMGASLVLALLVIKEHMNKVGAADVFTWFESSWWNSETGAITTKVFGFGIYIDHLTVMLLFVAAFLCFLINIFSIGYMNTDQSMTTETTDSMQNSYCSVAECWEWFLLIHSYGCSSSGN